MLNKDMNTEQALEWALSQLEKVNTVNAELRNEIDDLLIEQEQLYLRLSEG